MASVGILREEFVSPSFEAGRLHGLLPQVNAPNSATGDDCRCELLLQPHLNLASGVLLRFLIGNNVHLGASRHTIAIDLPPTEPERLHEPPEKSSCTDYALSPVCLLPR
jgi:hypothetical protein